MFDFGIFEIIVIMAVALFVIKPEDLPAVLRSCGKFVRKIKKISNEFTSALDDVAHEAGEIKTIIGDDGVRYQVYDVPDSKTSGKVSKEKNKVNKESDD